jgi:hypothetical protein
MLRPVIALIAGPALVAGLFAQAPAAPKIEFPVASPLGSLKQRVGVTDIEVTYNRPGAKGRKVFGGLVPYGQIWRTGADAATRVNFSTPVKLNGAAVPAGTYELFTIPGETEWTVIVQAVHEKAQWGSYAYDPKNDTARFTAKPEAFPYLVETFAINIGDVRDSSATLALFWEKTRVPIRVEIDTVAHLQPQIEAVMASDAEKKPYYNAAMFYYNNGLDLEKAAAWMGKAVEANPKAFWASYRYGLILAKKGDKAAALAAAQQSRAEADKQKGEIRDEYLRLNDALIASLK